MAFKTIVDVVFGKHDPADPKFQSKRGYAYGTNLELSVGDLVKCPMNNNHTVGTVRSLTSNYNGPVKGISEKADKPKVATELIELKVGQIVRITGRCAPRWADRRAQITKLDGEWSELVADDRGIRISTGCKIAQLVLDEDQTPLI